MTQETNVISGEDKVFYPVGAEVHLTDKISLATRTGHSLGVVELTTDDDGCGVCILRKLSHCSDYFPCYEEIRQDGKSVCLVAKGEPR